eukprot:scaffold324_cov326-Pavlova_lutheri.AAC.45
MPKPGRAPTYMERKLKALRQESSFKKGLEEELVVTKHKLAEECEELQRKEAVDKLLAEVWNNVIKCRRSPQRRQSAGTDCQSTGRCGLPGTPTLHKSKWQQEIEAPRMKDEVWLQEERNAPSQSIAPNWEGLSLGECLTKHKSKMEREVEAAKASRSTSTDGRVKEKLPGDVQEVRGPGLDEVLRPHRSRLALGVEAARHESLQTKGTSMPGLCIGDSACSSDALNVKEASSSDGWGMGWDDLGLKKHRCRVDREREAWLASVRASQPP